MQYNILTLQVDTVKRIQLQLVNQSLPVNPGSRTSVTHQQEKSSVVCEWLTDTLIMGISTFDIDNLAILGFNPYNPNYTTNNINTDIQDGLISQSSNENILSSSDNNDSHDIEFEVNIVNREAGTIVSSDVISLAVSSSNTNSSELTFLPNRPSMISLTSNQHSQPLGKESVISPEQQIYRESLARLMNISKSAYGCDVCSLLSSHQQDKDFNLFYSHWQLDASQVMRGGTRYEFEL